MKVLFWGRDKILGTNIAFEVVLIRGFPTKPPFSLFFAFSSKTYSKNGLDLLFEVFYNVFSVTGVVIILLFEWLVSHQIHSM